MVNMGKENKANPSRTQKSDSSWPFQGAPSLRSLSIDSFGINEVILHDANAYYLVDHIKHIWMITQEPSEPYFRENNLVQVF